ncbi:hypothetical protein JW826_03710 [Candidatus Woesearchaeota archaeon]|nr:hypothetical protein [Candidatus Woesearchaeota archaeon]
MFRKRGVKKAQITLFIIIGLILLIVIFGTYTLLKRPGLDNEFRTETVPEEFKPVAGFVEDCMHKVALKGIKELGAHGGYIEPLNNQLTTANLKYLPAEPTKSDVVSLTDDDKDLVPFYLHIPGRSSYFNYQYSTAMPSLSEIEYQLARYLEREMPRCLEGFKALKDEGYDVVETSDEFKAKVAIRDKYIELFLNHPITIKSSKRSLDLKSYNTAVRFPLTEYYAMAIQMVDVALRSQFSESFTISLINYYSGVDTNLLPPFISHSDAPYIITWSKSKVQNDLNSLLVSYVPALQVAGSREYVPIEVNGDDVEAAFFKSLSMNLSNQSLENLSVTFLYKNRGMAMRVQPSRGEIIKPSVATRPGSDNLPATSSNTYRFFYDIAYPLFIEIRGYDNNTELPEYSFLFAIESNIIENKPALAWILGVGTADWDDSYITTIINLPNGVLNGSGTSSVPQMRSQTKSLFCEENTWTSGDIKVSVAGEDGQPLEDAMIGFGCGDYDQCFVGMTEINGSSASWVGQLPVCTGGYMYISKEGYGSRRVPLTTAADVNAWIPTQNLKKIRTLTATIKKKEILKLFLRDNDKQWSAGPASIGPSQDLDFLSEQVVMSIIEVGADVGDRPVSNNLIIGKEGVASTPVKLVPGRYQITATLIDENGVIIPANCTEVCTMNVVICTSHEPLPKDGPISMKPAMWGGLDFRDDPDAGGTITLTAADLDSGSNIEFYALKLPDVTRSVPPGACLIALDEMNYIGKYSGQFKSDLLPIIS